MNKKMNLNTVKAIALVTVVFCMAVAGYLFREHRTFKETVVVSDYCTEVKKLSLPAPRRLPPRRACGSHGC